WPRPATPIAWVAAQGANASIAVGKEAVPIRPRGQAYAAALWARRRGLDLADADSPLRRSMVRCTQNICESAAPAPVRLAIWQRRFAPDAEALGELCRDAEIVVIREGEGDDPACQSKLVLGARWLADGGPAEVHRTGSGFRV